MRVLAIALTSLSLVSNDVSAFRPAHHSRSRSILQAGSNLHEFDYLLTENTEAQIGQQQLSRRRIHLNDDRQTVLASSTFAGPGVTEEAEVEASTDEVDPYAEIGLEQVGSQALQVEIQDLTLSQKIENKLKNMDLQDIVSTLILPSILAFAGLRWGFNKAAGKAAMSKDTALDDFANDMIYHDGDFEEMRLCQAEYAKKLVWIGPQKNNVMIKRYLALYAKKKTVSPQAISSLSYAFSLFKLSEEQAAGILVSLCREMGESRISSAGKLLFFGSRILKSPEGKAALSPIKDMIKATYREESVAETMVETSQQAMGEAAYRAAVLEAGKDQESLTVGWEVLGLTKEVATRIFEEEAEEGFLSDREKMYGGQSQKYDAKGNAIDKDGNVVESNEINDEDDEN